MAKISDVFEGSGIRVRWPMLSKPSSFSFVCHSLLAMNSTRTFNAHKITLPYEFQQIQFLVFTAATIEQTLFFAK